MVTGTRVFEVIETVVTLSTETWEVVRYQNSYYARWRDMDANGAVIKYSDTGPYAHANEAREWIEKDANEAREWIEEVYQ